MVAQVIRKIYKAVRVAYRLLQEHCKEGVRATIQSVKTKPEEGFIQMFSMLRWWGRSRGLLKLLVCIERVWIGIHATVPFANFVGIHGDLFSASQIERINVLSEGIMFLPPSIIVIKKGSTPMVEAY
ncbi:hypothetical protein SUGI_1495970 [Cryptomeria japonica]|uniref:Uncharacterized protein n=1 Tax=Cryptomeria japonica TaxID=3369 RepID=A0AAD3RRP3_CRYJA|nr:hypothetical protein SUGI_1495970 [Cryptomeria japonica]